MYPSVRNVGRGNTRCKKKKKKSFTATYTCGAHFVALCRKHVSSVVKKDETRLSRRVARVQSRDTTELNEFTALDTLYYGTITRSLHHNDGRGTAGRVCALSLSSVLLFSGELGRASRSAGSKINALSAQRMHRPVTG